MTGAQLNHCVLQLFLLLAIFAAAPAWAQARPNIVMIMVDDAGLMDFEPFGGEAKMPTIQKLAGITFGIASLTTQPGIFGPLQVKC